MGLFGKSDTPIKLISFKPNGANYSIEMLGAELSKDNDDYIVVSINIKNESDKVIDAVMIGFEFFTVFNDYQDHLKGYSLSDIKPGKQKIMTWKYLIYEASLIGGVIGYPYKVRYKDGVVWKADLKEIEQSVESEYATKIDIVEEEKKKRNK